MATPNDSAVGKSAAERAARIRKDAETRAKLLKEAASRGSKLAQDLLEGKDPTDIKLDDIGLDSIPEPILGLLPPEAQKAIADAKKAKAEFDKLFPKDDKGDRDFSPSGAVNVGLDLLGEFGGKDVQKALQARKDLLALADKLGINVPSIKELMDFDWDTLSDKLADLDFSDVVSIDKLLDSLQGELLKFLPPGMAGNLKYIQDMLKEFGLPTDLKGAYRELKKEADKPAAPVVSVATMPGVYVEGHLIARVGQTFMAHGAVPLAGTGAATVKAMGAPVWRALADMHTCPVPLMAFPSPDGPNKASQGSKKVKVEKFEACRHDVDSVDIPVCTKTNLFLTPALAKSAWAKLQLDKQHKHEAEKPTAPAKNSGNKGTGPGATGQGNGKGDGTDGDEKTKPKQPIAEEIPPVIAQFSARSGASQADAGPDQAGVLYLQCDSPKPGVSAPRVSFSVTGKAHYFEDRGDSSDIRYQYTISDGTNGHTTADFTHWTNVSPAARFSVKLKVTGSQGQTDECSMEFLGGQPVATLTSVTVSFKDASAPNRNSDFFTWLLGEEAIDHLVVVGDRLKIEVACSSNSGAKVVGYGIAVANNPSWPPALWLDGNGGAVDFELKEAGHLQVAPICLDQYGFFSDWGAPKSVFVNQLFTRAEVVAALASALGRLGAAVAIPLFIGSITALAPVTAAGVLIGSAYAIVDEALSQLGCPLLFRVAVGAAGGWASGMREAQRRLTVEAEGAVRVGLANAESAIWRAKQLGDTQAMADALMSEGSVLQVQREIFASGMSSANREEMNAALLGAVTSVAEDVVSGSNPQR